MFKFSLFLVFVALFGSSLAFWPFSNGEEGNGRFPPPRFPDSGESRERGEGRGRGEFPRPPAPTFLRSVNQTERREWFEIEHNRNATKAEILAEQDQWAANQTSEVQQLYNEYKEDKLEFILNITAKADEIAANFSQEAQAIYNQIKEILQNQDITKAEECDQIREALSNATKEIRRELKPLKRMIGKKCGGHHKRGPGGPPHGHGPHGHGGPRDSDEGPFANNGGFNGPRPRGSGSNSDESGPRGNGGRRGSGSNSNEDTSEDSDERPRPSRGPRPSRRPLPTGRPRPTGPPRPTGFPTDLPIDGSTNGQFPTIQPSSTTPGGFFRNLFRF